MQKDTGRAREILSRIFPRKRQQKQQQQQKQPPSALWDAAAGGLDKEDRQRVDRLLAEWRRQTCKLNQYEAEDERKTALQAVDTLVLTPAKHLKKWYKDAAWQLVSLSHMGLCKTRRWSFCG
jgi:hypothetical protein